MELKLWGINYNVEIDLLSTYSNKKKKKEKDISLV